MAGRRALGLASRDGAVSRVGDRAKEHPVVSVLSVVDLVLFKLGRAVAHTSGTTNKEQLDV